MLQWNELRVTSNGRYLVIDVEVQNLDYYKDVYIDSLHFVCYTNAEDCDPINDKGKKVLLWRDYDAVVLDEDKYIEVGEEGKHYKHIRKIVDLEIIKDNNLFFVYATANGDIAEDTPCGAKEKVLMGVTYNKYLLYRNSVGLLRNMVDCTPNKELIDYILSTSIFNLSLETGDYKTAIAYWNRLFKESTVIKHSCGCHGY